MPAAVGVEAFVVDDPQVVAFAEVVPEADVGRDGSGGAVVLDEGVGGQVDVERGADAEPADVHVERFVAVGEADPVVGVAPAQLQVARCVPDGGGLQGDLPSVVKRPGGYGGAELEQAGVRDVVFRAGFEKRVAAGGYGDGFGDREGGIQVLVEHIHLHGRAGARLHAHVPQGPDGGGFHRAIRIA